MEDILRKNPYYQRDQRNLAELLPHCPPKKKYQKSLESCIIPQITLKFERLIHLSATFPSQSPRNSLSRTRRPPLTFWCSEGAIRGDSLQNRLFDAIYNVVDIIVGYVWAGRETEAYLEESGFHVVGVGCGT